MKTIVLYDSLYGNTEMIAQAIAKALENQREVQINRVGKFSIEMLSEVETLVVGSPTQRFRPTIAVNEFLKSIPKNGLHQIKAAAFDTRLTMAEIEKSPPLAFFVRIYGYAAEPIAKQLVKKGAELIQPAEGFYVEGMEGPLVNGELERAGQWARSLFA